MGGGLPVPLHRRSPEAVQKPDVGRDMPWVLHGCHRCQIVADAVATGFGGDYSNGTNQQPLGREIEPTLTIFCRGTSQVPTRQLMESWPYGRSAAQCVSPPDPSRLGILSGVLGVGRHRILIGISKNPIQDWYLCVI